MRKVAHSYTTKLTGFSEKHCSTGEARPVLLSVHIAFPITSPIVSAASRIISGVAWV